MHKQHLQQALNEIRQMIEPLTGPFLNEEGLYWLASVYSHLRREYLASF